MEFIRTLLSDKGDISMMRLLSLIIAVSACILAFRPQADTALVLGMLGLALTGKVAQKVVE